MIPKILHQTSPQPLNWAERRISGEALRLMPDWAYRHWSDDDLSDLVREILPELEAAYHALRPRVIKADVGRCLLLYKHGGVYFDTDYRFFKPLDDAFRAHRCVMGIEASRNPGTGGQDKLGNAFMAGEPGLPFWLPFVRDVFARYRVEERVVFLSGPHALTLFLARHPAWQALVNVRPGSELYPPFRMAKLTALRTPDTIGAHLCWGGWRDKSRLQRLRNRARILGSALI